MKKQQFEIATLGGGCFWCIEAIFQEVRGIIKVTSGFSGRRALRKPSYKEVCSGLTGFAEVVKIAFDPDIITYEELLYIFMTSHDPTTLNRQGADVGSQYRSVIYYHDEIQHHIALNVLNQVSIYYPNPIVTELSAYQVFYKADDIHQNYYKNNRTKGYCSFVITPKLRKFRKMHSDKLKTAI